MHPLTVMADLRNGCIDSLIKYVCQEQGIPDLGVAYRLLMLFVGDPAKTRYRLIVIEHPDLPKSVGGAPPRNGRPPDLAFAVSEELSMQDPLDDEVLRASRVAQKFRISPDKVAMYHQAVIEYQLNLRLNDERRAAERLKMREDFETALANLQRDHRLGADPKT